MRHDSPAGGDAAFRHVDGQEPEQHRVAKGASATGDQKCTVGKNLEGLRQTPDGRAVRIVAAAKAETQHPGTRRVAGACELLISAEGWPQQSAQSLP